jgi:hypothetical protein
LVVLDGKAEHDWGGLLEVVPELGVLALGEKVLENIGIGGGGELGSGSSFAETVHNGERSGYTFLELVHLGLSGIVLFLHVWFLDRWSV